MRDIETDGKRRSIVKIFVMLAVFAGLVVAVLTGGGKFRGALLKSKMTADVALLNNAARTFKSRGGTFSPDETVGSVLEALKKVGSNRRLPGFSGALVENGLTWKMQSEEEAASDKPRVVWLNDLERFEIKYQGDPGVASFSIDPSKSGLENVEPEETQNGSAFMYSENSGWIWDYDEEVEKKATVIEPTTVTLAGATTEPDRWIPVSLDTSAQEKTEPSNELRAPTFSKPGGAYNSGDFDLKVSLVNPNPAGSSEIIYSIDYGPWKKFEGAPVEVQPGETIIARTQSTDIADSGDSPISFATYSVSSKKDIAVNSGSTTRNEPIETGPQTVTLSFGDASVNFEGTGNHYYLDIAGKGAKMGLLVSDNTNLNDARKDTRVTGNGDTCAYWLSNGMGQGSTTITMDFSENPAMDLDFKIYDINVAKGGDKLTVRAQTDRGTVLADPIFTYLGNSPDGITYDPAKGEATVEVRFSPPAGEAISSMTIKWEESSPSVGSSPSIGLGEITFRYQPDDSPL